MRTGQYRGGAATARAAELSVPPEGFSPFGRAHRFRVQLHQLIDAVLIAAAMLLAYQVRRWLPNLRELPAFGRYTWSYLVVMPVSMYLFAQSGLYKRVNQTVWRLVWIVAKGVTLSILVMIALAYLSKEEVVSLSRVWLALWAIFASTFVVVEHVLSRRYLYHRAGIRDDQRRIVALLGSRQQNQDIAQQVASHPEWGVLVAAALDLQQYTDEELIDALHAHHVECVMLTTGKFSFERIGQVIALCETEGVDVWVMADFIKPSIAKLSFDQFNHRPVLVFASKPDRDWHLLCKRALDFIGAAVMLLIVGPLVMLPVAIAIKLTSKGPIFFTQARCGLHGKTFSMLKFRSMVTNAEDLRDGLVSLNEQDGPVFKIARDPRVTPLGRLIRRTSIDELPQLFNVLRGHMSLVGPRPPIPSEVVKYAAWQRRRLSMKPGLTCLWQVSGRSRIKFEEWMRLDLAYIDSWSLALDFKILARTVPAVIMGDGTK
ncbi:MAG TPA: sugar transferase [Polyangia bacterium]